MSKLYKVTDSDGQTRNGTQWGPGVSHSGTGEGGLCGPGWIHAYEHPLIAVLMSPIHIGFKNPRLWEAEGEVALRDGQLKCGCKTLTTVREIPLPAITMEMRVRFAICCAKEVCPAAYLAWNAWADKWLSGEDRTQAAAKAAAKCGPSRLSFVAAAATLAAAETAETTVAELAAWVAELELEALGATDIFAIAENACSGLTFHS